MKVSIFFKFFAIIFVAFLLFQYVNIKVDYKSAIEYRIALLKDNRDSKKTDKISTIQENAISETQFIDLFNHTYQTSGYDAHFLVKVMPSGNYEVIGSVKQTDYNEPYIILNCSFDGYEDYYVNHEEDNQKNNIH